MSTRSAAATGRVPRRDSIRIDLGLQGGGAHGAFTWGVLDRLLEDGRLSFEGISANGSRFRIESKIGRDIDLGGTPLWTRINSLDSPWALDDVIEIIAAATCRYSARFVEPPWRFVVVVGQEREELVTMIAEALTRHWGLGNLRPRGIASEGVLRAPALVLVFSRIPSSEGLDAIAQTAAGVQNLLLLAAAAGLALLPGSRFSPHGTHRNWLRLPYTAPVPVLDRAVALLRQALGPAP